MNTKQDIIDALRLAISDHKTLAGVFCDHDFVSCLKAAETVVAHAPEVSVLAALVEVAA